MEGYILRQIATSFVIQEQSLWEDLNSDFSKQSANHYSIGHQRKPFGAIRLWRIEAYVFPLRIHTLEYKKKFVNPLTFLFACMLLAS